MGKLSDLLGSTVSLDSNIIIYAVEGLTEYATPIQALLEAMDSGEITGVTSDLTLAEVLVKPKQDQNQPLQEAYRRFLNPTHVLLTVDCSESWYKGKADELWSPLI
jgi:predicted nucleic acid-binding protein